MPKSATQLDKEIADSAARRHLDAINDAIYRTGKPDRLATAVREATAYVNAMKRVARKAPNHPGSSYFVNARGEFDPVMYDLANALVLAKQHLKALKRRR